MIGVTFSIIIGKISYFIIKLFNLGYGSSFPGLISRRIYPDIYSHLIQQSRKKIIYISGTNGKTTTTHFLATIFTQEKVIYNASGANLEAGLITSLIMKSNWLGRLKGDYVIFEVDEKYLPSLLTKSPPDLLICLNLFRDQLDRYGEIEAIKESWSRAMKKLPPHVQLLFNGDDPLLTHLSQEMDREIHYFGLNDENHTMKELSYAVDSIYCPTCNIPLDYRRVYLSHLGDFSCTKCTFVRGYSMQDSQKWNRFSPHIHNQYNSLAAICAALLSGKKEEEIQGIVSQFSPAFGRGERISVNSVHILFLLSKNPSSLNVSISCAKDLKRKGELGGILLALNDEDADGKDISWIWDAEMEQLCRLSKHFFITGKRAHEMAMCLKYFSDDLVPITFFIETDLKTAIRHATHSTPIGKTLCIMPTYTAMLQLREEFVGRVMQPSSNDIFI